MSDDLTDGHRGEASEHVAGRPRAPAIDAHHALWRRSPEPGRDGSGFDAEATLEERTSQRASRSVCHFRRGSAEALLVAELERRDAARASVAIFARGQR